MDGGSNAGVEETIPKDFKAEKKRLEVLFKAQHGIVVAFFTIILILHALGIYLFCSGFLLSRLVLEQRSTCSSPPLDLHDAYTAGDANAGCWHPKSFDKAIIIVIDALRYDFTVPYRNDTGYSAPHHFHNALSVPYETSVNHPSDAFLRPFIADPPTTTLQRLKGLTTGTLPTFIDAGSNFAGTAIDEDNLVEQLFKAGKRVVHLGDDTWHSLFPGYFEPELTKAYDSFNVWDLHTVDNGVNEHLFPLLDSSMYDRWDVIIGHYLGVDHAGHRYGPDHPAMNEKLRQMDNVLRDLKSSIDDKTLLVVMGDHGMDVKGDHGGESDDEVQAALWMYSKAGIFGRVEKDHQYPPRIAKERFVNQIDLVPTLAFLLGLPVPFNNLGQPIEEAFIGKEGIDFQNLGRVSSLTAAQIHQYQEEYSKARHLDEETLNPVQELWARAGDALAKSSSLSSSTSDWRNVHDTFARYQAANLELCKSMWARFDLVSMGMGISILIGSFCLLTFYSFGISEDRAAITPLLVFWSATGFSVGALLGFVLSSPLSVSLLTLIAFLASLGGISGMAFALLANYDLLTLPLPSTVWGSLGAATCLMLCIGFAANSFTIWEDQQLLFFLTTFAVLMLGSSLGQADAEDRRTGTINSISFLIVTRISSLSRLCREEQMPFCRSSYYASATSSTSAAWQLVIPLLVAIILPTLLVRYYHRTRNYQGSAVIWIGIALRVGLVLVAIFWIADAADDGDWYPGISKDLLKTGRALVAQVVLSLTFAAGLATYAFASPFLAVKEELVQADPKATSKPVNGTTGPILTTVSSAPPKAKLIIMGYANTHGTRYFLLPCVWILALLLMQKPMGQGTLALCLISVLNVLEVVDANQLHRSAFGPVILALLGSFYFFKTGHQATIPSVQWDSAFIPLKTVQYPWTPIFVTLNTCGAQIICAMAVPAIPMWKIRPRSEGLLGRIAASMAMHVLFYSAIAMATVVEAAWLRRHLMLYRIFMPRMLLAAVNMLMVDFVAAAIAVMGVRFSIGSVNVVFGWS